MRTTQLQLQRGLRHRHCLHRMLHHVRCSPNTFRDSPRDGSSSRDSDETRFKNHSKYPEVGCEGTVNTNNIISNMGHSRMLSSSTWTPDSHEYGSSCRRHHSGSYLLSRDGRRIIRTSTAK